MSNLEATLAALADYKVENIAHIDVKGASSLFDHIVVCTARSSQHAKTIAERIQYHFKPDLQQIPSTDGEEYGTWIAVDLDDVVLHVMLQEDREKYSIEDLWQELKKRSDETKD